MLVDQEAANVLMDLREAENGQSLLEEAMTTTMLVIVAVSASLLVASVLSAALLVIYCRRVKVRTTRSIFHLSLAWPCLVLLECGCMSCGVKNLSKPIKVKDWMSAFQLPSSSFRPDDTSGSIERGSLLKCRR